MEHSWIKQRAKAPSLTNSDDDLKYLYNSLQEKYNSNTIKELHIFSDILINSTSIKDEFWSYNSSLFNKEDSFTINLFDIPTGNTLSFSQFFDLGEEVSDQESIFALKDINVNKS